MAQTPDPALKAAILAVVNNQLRDGKPAETRATLDRLVADGHTREQAMELIACVVSSEIFGILKDRKPFDETQFVNALRKLPQLPWDAA